MENWLRQTGVQPLFPDLPRSRPENKRARNVGWRIDYFLVSANLKDKIKAAEIHPDVMGSDHCPVSIELDI